MIGRRRAWATQSALDQALAQADRAGEVPAVILISSPTGQENSSSAHRATCRLRRADHRGTAADNDMSGQWQQFGGDRVARQAFQSRRSFLPPTSGMRFTAATNRRGTGTGNPGRGRVLYEIDHRPAARLYNEWTDGLISAVLPGGAAWADGFDDPPGQSVGRVGDVPYYRWLIGGVVESEALALFTDVQQDAKSC
jgi:hypothetical protein